MLTAKGFPAKVRVDSVDEGGAEDTAATAAAMERKREDEARSSLVNLGVAWALVSVCMAHHLGHLLHVMGFHQYAHTDFMMVMGNPWLSGALGALALLGPGRG